MRLALLFLVLVGCQMVGTAPTELYRDPPPSVDSFDWRNQSDCGEIIATISNASFYPSGWAYASAEMIRDRLCVANSTSKLPFKKVLICADQDASPAVLKWGTQGGGCYVRDYSAHQAANASSACLETCSPPIPTPKLVALLTGSTPSQIDAIKNEIKTHGPILAAVEIDTAYFQYYLGGVISDPSCGSNMTPLTTSYVRIIGWGEDSGYPPYWIAAYSLGSSWGESGSVRIARGSNICGIESAYWAAQPTILNK
jgi:hypothetical protein